MQNCRTWVSKNPLPVQPFLQSEMVTVWYRIIAMFVVQPFFFKEITSVGPVIYTLTANWYESLLSGHVLPELQQRQCVNRPIFL
ncbi:transposable element tc3 transposase [Trichonephila clavipes]|nr:transposable element tc3 transposase [Trichonephila clavipes]